jgi:hypothetical protein
LRTSFQAFALYASTAVLAVLTAVASLLNFRRFLRDRGRYLVEHLTDQDLRRTNHRVSFPSGWPDPFEPTTPELATAIRARTYAQFAEERAKDLSYGGEVLTLVAGAALGYALGNWASDPSQEAWTVFMLSGMLGTLGIVLRVNNAERWRVRASLYYGVAEKLARPSGSKAAQVDRPRSIIDRLLRRLPQ